MKLGYRYDCLTNTLILTKEYVQRAADCSSNEFMFLQQMRSEVPNLKVVQASRKKPGKSQDAHLSIDAMKAYISCIRDSEKRLAELEKVIETSVLQEHPILYVRKWFKDSYPHFNDIPRFDSDGFLIPCSEEKGGDDLS